MLDNLYVVLDDLDVVMKQLECYRNKVCEFSRLPWKPLTLVAGKIHLHLDGQLGRDAESCADLVEPANQK